MQADVAWAVGAGDLCGCCRLVWDEGHVVIVRFEEENQVGYRKAPPQVHWRRGGRHVRGDPECELVVQVRFLCPSGKCRLSRSQE